MRQGAFGELRLGEARPGEADGMRRAGARHVLARLTRHDRVGFGSAWCVAADRVGFAVAGRREAGFG